MRIVEINDIASVASEIGAGLRARGDSVTLIQPRLVGARLHPWLKPTVSPARAIEWVQLIRAIRRGDYDLAHIHYVYLGMLGVLGRFPFILHCHGTDLREATAVTRPLIARALAHADHVFYSTPDLAAYVLPVRPDGEFLPNPVDTTLFSPAPDPAGGDDVYIACWIEENKGAAHLLEACRVLLAERPEVRITALARGPYIAEFAQLPNVLLVEPGPRRKLPALIARHKVVVGQVRHGAVGMAEIEAMACGRPLVARFRYGRAYPEPPPIVNAEDGRAIAAAVLRLLDAPAERLALGEETRSWVERHHAREVVVARVEAVAEAIVAGVDPSRVTA